MKLGKYFTLEEMTHSQTAARMGIDNTPSPAQIDSLVLLVAKILDPLRQASGRPITVSSGFRSYELNKAVGGAINSQHTMGQAADITLADSDISQTIDLIRALALPFDQLIDEFGRWVHVSYGPKNRGQVLKARRDSNGRTVYTSLED